MHSAGPELWGLWGDFAVPGTTSGWIVEHEDHIRIKKQKREHDNFCEQTICWARICKNYKKTYRCLYELFEYVAVLAVRLPIPSHMMEMHRFFKYVLSVCH